MLVLNLPALGYPATSSGKLFLASIMITLVISLHIKVLYNELVFNGVFLDIEPLRLGVEYDTCL